MTKTALIALSIILGTAAGGGFAKADLVTNGGFETENLDMSDNPIPPPPGWAIGGDSVGIDSVFPNTGSYDVFFGALATDPSAGTLSQVITTTAGQGYSLDFALLDEAGFSGDSFLVTFGDFSTTITGDEAAPPGNLPSFYTAELFTIPGIDIIGASTTLSFQGLSDPAVGLVWNLDDVSLGATAIPEPPTPLLFLTAIAACFVTTLAGRGLTRRKSVQ